MHAPRSRGRPEPAPASAAVARKRRSIEPAPLRLGVAVAALLIHASALAQLSATVTLLSDYRYRGVSLSDNRPAAQIGIAYDHPAGGYVGVFASGVRYAEPAERGVQTIAYGGYAWRSARGTSFEAGAAYTSVSGELGYDYPEIYVGFSGDAIAARLYYAPRYSGYDTDTLYAEINGTWRLNDRTRLLGHAGVLRSPVNVVYFRRPEFVGDARVGVAVDIERITLQLAWVGVTSAQSYPFVVRGGRNRAVLSLSATF
jgi:uncharacterized protein (TIGR02001 family)